MRYLAAYMLVTLGGKANPSAEDIERVLSSVGIDADRKKIDLVLSKLQGKDVQSVITEGSKKLSSLPTTAPSSGAAAPAAAAGGAKEAAAPAAKEEAKKKEEPKEEEDEDMGFGLFD
ncbi:hypothetical protein RvY_15730 [Ramazzottius varieornatus]|uniref:Large ribosomal subunit protein P2 n=1 Tax=Ramazzottius varieornatus TaxID=947166 RepID=A0A1D1VVY6_RAMVA|nr:hypothetical protein RvY_15730 [Ramazzottius varieornatus]